jgi:hypothetical protein
MKLEEALKKFNFLKRLDLPDKVLANVANHLLGTLKGHSEIYLTPLAKALDPFEIREEWDLIFNDNKHKMNIPLLDLEASNRSKFGPRSIAVPWTARVTDLKATYLKQDEDHIPKYHTLIGEGNLFPISVEEAGSKMKSSTSACLPFFTKKGKAKTQLLEDFNGYLKRKDPCLLFTRTSESSKTRNVWGYPFADTLFEMMFYYPLLQFQKVKTYRAALVSPDEVALRLTELILKARLTDRIIYSIDFSAFDASVKFQYIIAAFEYIASCFAPSFTTFIMGICKRFYTISIITPQAVYSGKHGVPSGSTFTNEVDSIIQLMIALLNDFINEKECQVQGDDGVFIMAPENVPKFRSTFMYAGLKENDKGSISTDFATYCQNIYHIEYIKDGVIPGIYPVYRALNRILFQERFVNFTKRGIRGKDYYGIRCLSILENCKHHPLFEELVRFILAREEYSLDISDDGLTKYCSGFNLDQDTAEALQHQYGTNVSGIKNFDSYKMVQMILAEKKCAVSSEVESLV